MAIKAELQMLLPLAAAVAAAVAVAAVQAPENKRLQ